MKIKLNITQNEKSYVKTIDCTPTWIAILPMLLAGYEDGSATSRQIAKEELERMAKLADLYVASQKDGK